MPVTLTDAQQAAAAAALLNQPAKRHPKPPAPPKRNLFITFQGKGRGWQDSFAVLCGDKPPTPTGGWAKWQTIDRPLQRGLTVFQGYDPVSLSIDVRFGRWTSAWEWQTDDGAGSANETDIHKLETMAGTFQGAGQPPYVYLNTFDASGATTPLIPLTFQQTAGISGRASNRGNTWPWVITGLTFGDSIRNPSGYRVKQDATVTVMNYQGLSTPQTNTVRGGDFISRPGRDTMLLIAEDHNPHGSSLHPDQVAREIQTSPRNNPMRRSNIRLERKSVRWKIPHGKIVFVPAHAV